MRKPSKIGYSKFFYFLFDGIASSAPSPAAGQWVPGGWMGVCWSPGRGHRDRARAWPPAPCLLSDVAMAESTINFLYLINPVNPRSFPMGQKVCSARVTPSLRPGWSGALCGHPADWVPWLICCLLGSADRQTRLLFWVRLQLTSLSDEIGGSITPAHLLGCISLSFTANLRYLPYEVKTSGLS